MSLDLFDQPAAHAMADASLEAWDHIRRDLSKREITVYRGLCAYLAEQGYHDATGGELAAWMRLPVTTTRPRLHGLDRKGWVIPGSIRPSRAGELRAHGYAPVLPVSALDRLESK